ncbi:CLUMA_CG020362, isoform A [Gryllus bimaculatus]|nr:CLUMA_CG020362, isoform A [Gryllus bimaculatus]
MLRRGVEERLRRMLRRGGKGLMIALRKGALFAVRPGTNVSSVTVPYNVTFRDLAARPAGDGELQFNYCGCGWPHHMLLPMGTREGFQADLFVMVSDYAADEYRSSV